MENHENPPDPAPRTPGAFGPWLRAVDHLLAQELHAALAAEGATPRDWRLLTLLDSDDAAETLFEISPELAREIGERLRRHGGKKLRGLVERGWVTESNGAWTLTGEGRAARERLSGAVDGIRARVAGAVTGDDFATTVASLEAIARELGWSPEKRMPRGFGRRGFGRGRGFGPFGRHGFGPGHGVEPGHGFGPGHEFEPGFGPGTGFGRRGGFGPGFGPFGPGHGFGPGFGPHDGSAESCPRGHAHGSHDRHGGPWARAGRGHGYAHQGDDHSQRAYERGFEAGLNHREARRDA